MRISSIVMMTSLAIGTSGVQAHCASSSADAEKVFSAYVRAEQEAFDDMRSDVTDGICESTDTGLALWDFCQDAGEHLSKLGSYLKKGRRIGIPEKDWLTLKKLLETLRADVADDALPRKEPRDQIAEISGILHAFKVHEPDTDLPLGYGPWSAGDAIDRSNCATVLFKVERLRKDTCGNSRPRLSPAQKVETCCSTLDDAMDFTVNTDAACSIVAIKRPAAKPLTKDQRLHRARECVLSMEQVFGARR